MGPDSLSGDVGKAITDPGLTDLPIVDFQTQDGLLDDRLTKEELRDIGLSSDQLYFYKICCAIQTGKSAFEVDKMLQFMSPGTFHQAIHYYLNLFSLFRFYKEQRRMYGVRLNWHI